jgi:hypothetical protein
MDAKWTPGPWYANGFRYVETGAPPTGRELRAYSGDDPERITINATNQHIADLHRRGNIVADARLISAAPDLAFSLVEMVDMFRRHIDGKPGPDDAAARWDRARDALEKAGVTP